MIINVEAASNMGTMGCEETKKDRCDVTGADTRLNGWHWLIASAHAPGHPDNYLLADVSESPAS